METEPNIAFFSRTHVVMPGDTLKTLAKQYYDDESLAADLANVNGIAEHAILTAGSKIKIPHKAKLRRPLVKQLGDINTDNPQTPQTQVDTITVTAEKPWYLKPTTWILFAAGFGLAYFLLGKKKRDAF